MLAVAKSKSVLWFTNMLAVVLWVTHNLFAHSNNISPTKKGSSLSLFFA
jgi:hypothetical protein